MEFYHIARGEVKAAKAIAKAAGVSEHRIASLPELKELGDMRGVRLVGWPPTYIPQRNTIFYGIAASYAEEVGADAIIGGHNKEDLLIFEDTSDEYFERLQEAIWAASGALRARKTVILRPMRNRTKPEVIRYAAALGVPLELTWSCHGEGVAHCWNCDGCRSRTANFSLAGVKDPLVKGTRSGGTVRKS